MCRKFLMSVVTMCVLVGMVSAHNPINGLLERIDRGASRKFVIEKVVSDTDFFELDQNKQKVVVRGNSYVSIATGIHWYLKYHAGVHLTWNQMHAELPEVLPAVTEKERHDTEFPYRYDFNYCTHSYSMAFWDWNRWEEEIDWMALHGINMPLSIVGTGAVWRNVLLRLGYTKQEVNDFVAGPAFQAWWLMNNLEGWGGPNPDSWYNDQEALHKKIVKRMREFGIEPVLPGYSGMVPNNAKEKLGLDVANPGKWCDYNRPAFLQPTDPKFEYIAGIYYQEMTKLYGKARFYSMDPFHEGGSVDGVDLPAAGKAIWKAMKRANPKAVWVLQAWQSCPHDEMIAHLPKGDVVVLDLFSESRPQWGDPASTWYREKGFGQHDWLYCMLLNYGANVGLHGKMEQVIDGFYKAKESAFVNTLKGVGMTMEGIENNPVMYELLCELPWREERFDKEEWLAGYVKARYGKNDERVWKAWSILSNSIYNCPPQSVQQGTHESVFCARPSLEVRQVSSWAERDDYYNPHDVIEAARWMVEAADDFAGNAHFEYDLVDVVRQAVAEKGRLVYPVVVKAFEAGDRKLFEAASDRFLELILLQDRLLGTQPGFMVGTWLKQARDMGHTQEEKDLYEWNARVQITTWGNRSAADKGGLCDYAHKEWNGLLRDFYYMRWNHFFHQLRDRLDGKLPQRIDFYALEEPWTRQHEPYPCQPQGNAVEVAREVYRKMAQ